MKRTISTLLIFIGIEALVSGAVTAVNPHAVVLASLLSSIAVLLVLYLMKYFSLSDFAVKPKLLPIFGFSAILAITSILPSLYFQDIMPELPNIMEAEFELMGKNFWGVLFISLLAPVVEELVFRGIILKHLLSIQKYQTKYWDAILISAAVFAVVHGNPAQMPHAFLIGLLLGWLYYHTKSIMPGIVMHLVNNSIACVIYRFYPDPDVKLADMLGSDTTVNICVLISLVVFTITIYALNRKFHHSFGEELRS